MFERARKIFIPALASLACAACATGGPVEVGGATNLSMVQADSLPVPSAADYAASPRAFIIGPYDMLSIDVFGNEDLRLEEIQVDAGGRITFPLIGTVEVAGKTPGEAARTMEAMLKGRYLRNPQVTVNLKETSSQVVAISGEIKRPGVYPIVGDMTLLKAIARAEGWTEFSKKREVLVFRKVGGQQYAALYDAKAIERGQYADPELFPNDTVVVGDSQARRNMKDLFTVVPPIVGPLIFLLGQN
ncbi:polysaccharide biosynthesis/export family protein [Blastomonas aquatica]|uniref:GumB protein n=1 Tax=Blastomonas aquatica TaxID=1510276 RepID=A0ABQ1J006_9SPHN|nr:polysaccharide biosynthesis/export family protein [Blastomonas aquatica]GGB55449.1 GumB protein [Blastomonas aquatica]